MSMKVSDLKWPRETHTRNTAINYDSVRPGHILWITYDVINNLYSIELSKSGVRGRCVIRQLSEEQVNEIIQADNALFVMTYPTPPKK